MSATFCGKPLQWQRRAKKKLSFLSAERSPNRRRVLKGLGVALALPWLETFCGQSAHSSEQGQKSDGASELPSANRMLLISNNLGVLPQHFFPETAGADYQLSEYLRPLADHRNRFTVISGLSHPDVAGGHSTENCFLTAARGPTRSGFRNTISLDQFAAEALGPVTRFSTLNLGVNIDRANRSLAWTRDGALLPAEDSAATLFRRLFVQGDAKAVQRQLHRLEERASILDTLLADTNRLERQLSKPDQARLDQYLSSIRDVEHRLQAARHWEQQPRPAATQPAPEDIHDQKRFFDKLQLMLSMVQLALESDSTRIVTLMLDAFATPAFQLQEDLQTTEGYHNLSHHGQSPTKLDQLKQADHRQMNLLAELLNGLHEKQEADGSLLQKTMVLYGSNMGDSNTHDNTNLPILLAGGGFRHGQHLTFDKHHNTPLSNLFVSMLQQMGIPSDTFGSSTGTLHNLH